MNIGELFVDLGIKGTDKTISALGSVRKGLGDLKSMSLEAKAGIIGAIYALQRLVSTSDAMGTNLRNFNALTGLSAQTLQQWQYAARQAGVSGEEMSSSIKGVQSAMSNMLLGKGAPEGLSVIAGVNGGFDMSRARDTFYVMGELQKAAQKLPQDIGNQMIKSFGVSENVIAAMRRNAFRPDVFKRAPAYTPSELVALDKANIAWSNLGQKIEMAIGRFNAKHGVQFVQDLSKVTDQVIKLAEAFAKLAETLKLFQIFGKVFEGWTMVFDKLSQGVETINDASQDPEKAKKLFQNTKDFLQLIPGAAQEAGTDLLKKVIGGPPPDSIRFPQKNQNIEINQNLNFQHEGKNASQTGDSVHRATQNAFRQFSAQGQGS